MKDDSLLSPKPEPGHEYPELPERTSLPGYRESAAHCRACDLWKNATQALISPAFKVTKERGKLIASPLAPHVVATVHPSSILRAYDEAAREEEMRAFIADLRVVARLIADTG